MVEPAKQHCPKGVKDEVCPGKGVPENCRWYSELTKECSYIGYDNDYELSVAMPDIALPAPPGDKWRL
jgi:hypothetical protein